MQNDIVNNYWYVNSKSKSSIFNPFRVAKRGVGIL